MGICLTLDFQRNFPLTQFLSFFPPQRNCLLNPYFLGNWTENGFFMAENGAVFSTVASPTPQRLFTLSPEHEADTSLPRGLPDANISASLPGQCQTGSHVAEFLSKPLPAANSCSWLGCRDVSPTCGGCSPRNTLCVKQQSNPRMEVVHPSPNAAKQRQSPCSGIGRMQVVCGVFFPFRRQGEMWEINL